MTRIQYRCVDCPAAFESFDAARTHNAETGHKGTGKCPTCDALLREHGDASYATCMTVSINRKLD